MLMKDEVMDYHEVWTHWVHFLPLYLFEELVEGGVATHQSSVDIAPRVLEYACNDA
jgi:hypothetical protein